MKIGFTGSRYGMTDDQKMSFKSIIKHCPITVFCHGDCVGADEQAHSIVNGHTMAEIHVRPGPGGKHRANCEGDFTYPPSSFLSRNKDIVDESEMMIATPNSFEEQKRSGTWSTIRYTRKKQVTMCIIWPDGSVTYEKGITSGFKPLGG